MAEQNKCKDKGVDYDSSSDETEDYSNSDDEGKSGYRKGGYHPVNIGDVYNSRYTVHRKLGWGHFSTVWLATDSQVDDNHPHKCVALKIQKSASQYTEAAEDEIDLLWEIKKKGKDGPGGKYCVELLNHFKVYGPHGKHICMVFEVMGKNLLHLIKRFKYRGIPLNICKRITYQILIGLDFLHKECKIIHTDLKPENFLLLPDQPPSAKALLEERKALLALQNLKIQEGLKCLNLSDGKLTKKERKKLKEKLRKQAALEITKMVNKGNFKNKAFPRPERAEGAEGEGILGASVSSTSMSSTASGLGFKPEGASKELYITKISDLGNGCWIHKHFTDDITTRQYRSPEVILGLPYSCPTDIWSVACMVFELITGDYLFDPKEDK
eukprot:919843-Amorphochlora_amoeboformis.AAC.2